MFGRIHIAYKWVKAYTWLLAACAFLGNDFLKFSLDGLPFNPYRLVGLAAPAVLLFAPAEFWRSLWRSGARYYALFVVLLCAYALLSGLWVPDRGAWRQHTLFLLYGGLTTCLILGCLDSLQAVTRALRLFVFCAAAVAVGALVEILSGHYGFNTVYAGDYLWARDESFMGLPLPVWAMGNVNDFGAYLFFALAATLWLVSDAMAVGRREGRRPGAISGRGIVWRRSPVVGLYAAAGLLFLFLMLCTQSRSVFGALILAGAAGFGCWLLQRPKHWKRWLLLACGFFVAAVVGFVWFWFYDLPVEVGVHSDAVRVGVARNAWLFFKPVWYRGLGWGGVDYYNLQYPVYTVGDVPHLHNWFLEILFACGLFVFCFYGWVYVRTWWVNLRLVVDAGRVTAVRQAVVATATLSGFVALSMASSSFVPAQWFWAVGALGFGVAGLSPAPVSSVEKGAGVADNRAGYQAGNKARKKRL